jgi:hypothetical protein
MVYCSIKEAYGCSSLNDDLDVDVPHPEKAQTNVVEEKYNIYKEPVSEKYSNRDKMYGMKFENDYMQEQRDSAQCNSIDYNPYKLDYKSGDPTSYNIVRSRRYNPHNTRRLHDHNVENIEGFADYNMDMKDRRLARHLKYDNYDEDEDEDEEEYMRNRKCRVYLRHIKNCVKCKKSIKRWLDDYDNEESEKTQKTFNSLFQRDNISEVAIFIMIGIFIIFLFNMLNQMIKK